MPVPQRPSSARCLCSNTWLSPSILPIRATASLPPEPRFWPNLIGRENPRPDAPGGSHSLNLQFTLAS